MLSSISQNRCCEVMHAVVQVSSMSEEGDRHTVRRDEVLVPLHSDPTSRALLEDLHVVHLADLSYIIFDLLP